MASSSAHELTFSCTCGSVAFRVYGAPITCVACYCDDCQEAARRMEALPGAAPVRDDPRHRQRDGARDARRPRDGGRYPPP